MNSIETLDSDNYKISPDTSTVVETAFTLNSTDTTEDPSTYNSTITAELTTETSEFLPQISKKLLLIIFCIAVGVTNLLWIILTIVLCCKNRNIKNTFEPHELHHL